MAELQAGAGCVLLSWYWVIAVMAVASPCWVGSDGLGIRKLSCWALNRPLRIPWLYFRCPSAAHGNLVS